MFAMLVGALASVAVDAFPIETGNIAVPDQGGVVALHCVAPHRDATRAVLFVHGSTFPTKSASGFEFQPGDSWMHFMARQGYLACGLDFIGFGASSVPDGMKADASAYPPVLRAPQAADQIAAAVDYLRAMKGIAQIHVVAHSWGTIPAGAYAARHPHELRSLTLFGPVVPTSAERKSAGRDAWFPLTAQQRLDQLRFRSVLPAGKVLLEPAVESTWARQFRSSTPHTGEDAAEVIRIPNGPNVDVEAAASGKYPYAPEDVDVPLFVVYGNYDVVLTDAEASAFADRFRSSPMKWQLRISDGTHVMHLERQRWSLYESVAAFIRATSDGGR